MKVWDSNRRSDRYAYYYMELKNGDLKKAYVAWDEASGQFYPFEKDMFYANISEIKREYIRAGLDEKYIVSRDENGYPYTKRHTDSYYDE